MTTQATASLSTQNTASLVLQNQNVSNVLSNSQLAAISSSTDPLQAAWNKMVTDLKVDFNSFIIPATKEFLEGTKEITAIVNNDFQVFAAALNKDVKTQVDTLMATLTKEAKDHITPQLETFASKVEQNLLATGKKALTDIWNEALPIIIDTAKITLNTLASGQVTPAAIATIAVQVMQSPHMKELTANLQKDLMTGVDTAIKDAKDTWTAIEPTVNGEIKTALINFGAAVAARTTIQSAIFVANLTKDVAAEVNELHNKYGDTNKQNLVTMAKDLLVDAGKVVQQVSIKVVSGAKSLVSKIKKLFGR